MPGGWQTPMPARVGGGAARLIADLYATAKAGGGSLLNGEPGTETDVENMVIARTIAIGWRIAQAYAVQGDPRKLSAERRPVTFPDGHTEEISPLERMERIHELTPLPNDTLTQRRFRVYMHERLQGRADSGALWRLFADVFGDWAVTWTEYTAADATVGTMFWPGGANTPAYPGSPPTGTLTWANVLLTLFLTVNVPTDTSTAELTRKQALFAELIDLVLPAALDCNVSYL